MMYVDVCISEAAVVQGRGHGPQAGQQGQSGRHSGRTGVSNHTGIDIYTV